MSSPTNHCSAHEKQGIFVPNGTKLNPRCSTSTTNQQRGHEQPQSLLPKGGQHTEVVLFPYVQTWEPHILREPCLYQMRAQRDRWVHCSPRLGWVKGQKWLAQKRECRSAPPGRVRKNSQQLTSHTKNITHLIKHELGQYPTYFKAICSFPTELSTVLSNAFELQSSRQVIPTSSCHLNHAIAFTSFL